MLLKGVDFNNSITSHSHYYLYERFRYVLGFFIVNLNRVRHLDIRVRQKFSSDLDIASIQ